jgi:hypothetical protein
MRQTRRLTTAGQSADWTYTSPSKIAPAQRSGKERDGCPERQPLLWPTDGSAPKKTGGRDIGYRTPQESRLDNFPVRHTGGLLWIGDGRRIASPVTSGYIQVIVPDAAVKSLLLSFAYVFCLIAALVVVNIALTRLTREDREAERERRRQRKPS